MNATDMTRRGFLAGATAALAVPARAIEVARFGKREVHVLTDGAFVLPRSALVQGQPKEAVDAMLRAENLPVDEVRSVLNVTLIRDGDDWTLIDCGSGDKFLPGSGKLPDSLEAAGVDRAKVKRVLFTHAHPDHLWGAVDSFDDPMFPNAEFLMSEEEWAFWTAKDVFSRVPEDRQMFAAGAHRVLKVIADRMKRFKPGQEVAPGIVAVDSAGHSPGHMCFAVSGEGKSLMVLGDALTNAAISFRRPDWISGSDMDGALGARTRRRLLDQLTRDRLPFIGYHLPVPGIGRAETFEGAFRFSAGA